MEVHAATTPRPQGGATVTWFKNNRKSEAEEAYGRGSLPLHNLVSDSANPHYVSDPLPQSFVGSS